MSEYTSLKVSEWLAEVRKKSFQACGQDKMGGCESCSRWYALSNHREPRLLPYNAEVGEVMGQSEIAPAYHSGTLVTWLIDCGYMVEILRDAAGDIHACAGQYSITQPTIPDALAELVMKVLEVEA